ncbi:ACT domain-containing protein ACR12 [Vitis vinifera]|uniref:ACT domain-containing protein ACR n=1 Tax=Vitis vinifera TaxID=29760 RepID=A0A438DNG9_VITVI|nr:ACT domain-containing protein ACR12 [Vitis vinifera]
MIFWSALHASNDGIDSVPSISLSFDPDSDYVPTPMVLIDQDSDSVATIVQLSFGDRLGALVDTAGDWASLIKKEGIDVGRMGHGWMFRRQWANLEVVKIMPKSVQDPFGVWWFRLTYELLNYLEGGSSLSPLEHLQVLSVRVLPIVEISFLKLYFTCDSFLVFFLPNILMDFVREHGMGYGLDLFAYGPISVSLDVQMKALKGLDLDVQKELLRLRDQSLKQNFSLPECNDGRKVEDPDMLERIRLTIINNLLKYHPESSEQLAMGEAFGIKAPEKKVILPALCGGILLWNAVRIQMKFSLMLMLQLIYMSKMMGQRGANTWTEINGMDPENLNMIADRPGLLLEIVEIITDVNVDVESAEIDTEGLVAKDKFHVSYRGAALSSSLSQVTGCCQD